MNMIFYSIKYKRNTKLYMPKNLVKMHDRQTTMNFLRSEESDNLFPTKSDHSKIHLIAIDLITGDLNVFAQNSSYCQLIRSQTVH